MSDVIAEIFEGSTPKITFLVTDEDGDGLGSAALQSLTLTYYNKADGEIINSRDGQNVLNTNNVTVDASGNGVWKLLAADTAIVDTTIKAGNDEVHIALFEWAWLDGDSDQRQGKHEIEIRIRQHAKVP